MQAPRPLALVRLTSFAAVALTLGLAPTVGCNQDADNSPGGGGPSSGGHQASGGGSSSTSGGQAGGGGPSSGGDELGGHGGDPAEPPLCFNTVEVPSCASVGNWAELTRPLPRPVEMAQASEVANDAHFVMLGGDAALVEVPSAANSEKYQMALVNPDADPTLKPDLFLSFRPLSWPGADGDWTVTSIGTPWEAQARLLALACDSSRCVRLGADIGDDSLEPLDEPGLPLDALGYAVSERSDCVFGKTIYCLSEGQWKEGPELPADSGTRIVALDANFVRSADEDFGPSSAITDTGAILLETDAGNWEVRHDGTSAQMASASLAWPLASVLLTDGTWYEVDLASEGGRECEQPSPLAFAHPTSPNTGTYFALNPAGHTFVRASVLVSNIPPLHYSSDWCQHSSEAFLNLKAATTSTCGLSANFYAISDSTFWSLLDTPECAIE